MTIQLLQSNFEVHVQTIKILTRSSKNGLAGLAHKQLTQVSNKKKDAFQFEIWWCQVCVAQKRLCWSSLKCTSQSSSHLLIHNSKIQLVVYYQCCVLIGWPSASWAIDIEPIRAQGIIVYYTLCQASGKPDFLWLPCVLFLLKLIGVFLIIVITEEKEKSKEHWVRFLSHNLVQVVKQ